MGARRWCAADGERPWRAAYLTPHSLELLHEKPTCEDMPQRKFGDVRNCLELDETYDQRCYGLPIVRCPETCRRTVDQSIRNQEPLSLGGNDVGEVDYLR